MISKRKYFWRWREGKEGFILFFNGPTKYILALSWPLLKKNNYPGTNTVFEGHGCDPRGTSRSRIAFDSISTSVPEKHTVLMRMSRVV